MRTKTTPFGIALAIALLVSVMCSLFAVEAGEDAATDVTARLRGVRRIVFLGDSITQAGDYVTDFECWLLARGLQVEVLNLGLGSETAADLTPAENASHLKKFGFGRPFLSERLGRVLAATKPDWLFACYGMNDGTSLPPDETGTKRFAEAVTNLRTAAIAAGVKRVVICTPPVHDGKGHADENLTRYTAWLLSKRAAGWDVADLHTPMRQALDEGRVKDPDFRFARDGVHPGREGHWLMARAILKECFNDGLEGVSSAEGLFPARGPEIRTLVQKRMKVRFNAWMSHLGHKRRGVAGGPNAKPGLPLGEAETEAAGISKQINLEMNH